MEYHDRDISDLIPDYCSDSLDAEQKAEFERRLQEDQELAKEVEDFREFQELYREIDPAEPTPSDALFNRITQNIEAEQQVTQTPASVTRVFDFLRSSIQQIRESIAVPWGLAAVQAIVLVVLLMPATEENKYATLSATEKAATVESIGINVVFQPSAAESDIRALMLDIGGTMKGGPSKEGRYLVNISNSNELDETVELLKTSEVVLFAEPVN